MPPHTHTHTYRCSHTQSAVATSAPCKLSLIPFHSDPCQARVTLAGQGHHTIHTHSCLHLFICFLVSLRLLVCPVCPHPVQALFYIAHLNLWSGQSCLVNYHLYFITRMLGLKKKKKKNLLNSRKM